MCAVKGPFGFFSSDVFPTWAVQIPSEPEETRLPGPGTVCGRMGKQKHAPSCCSCSNRTGDPGGPGNDGTVLKDMICICFIYYQQSFIHCPGRVVREDCANRNLYLHLVLCCG